MYCARVAGGAPNFPPIYLAMIQDKVNQNCLRQKQG
jgi:hypothetical protein